MTPEDMADLHARAFAGQGRAWSAAEFSDLLASPMVFAVGGMRGFALGRVIADEAEVLTIATDPLARRQGIARACLAAFQATASRRGARSAFLEVADDNAAARGLYSAAGYMQAAVRKGYYTRPKQTAVDALILRRDLTDTPIECGKSEI